MTHAAPASSNSHKLRRCMFGLLWGVCLLAMLNLNACALPSLAGRSESYALSEEQAQKTLLGRALAPYLQQQPGLSGIHALHDAHDAFVARILLARLAERTLDVQYYIWRDDMTGTLLLHELQEAARRGVRVRLLLDDHGTGGLDERLRQLAGLDNFEVRLFNPFVLRRPKLLGFVTDFSRLNRRMHNKSFTADNRVTVVGGRNVGDEYFGATNGVLFVDLDVIAIGPVVHDVSADFDRYWASAAAYPVERLIDEVKHDRRLPLAEDAGRIMTSPEAGEYARALAESSLARQLLDSRLVFEWAHVRMISDDPGKVLGSARKRDLMVNSLAGMLQNPGSQVDLVSPYFIPTEHGVKALAGMVANGVRVRILTNSLRATDVPLVHAGYTKYRRALLGAGIELYELRGKLDAHRPEGGAGLFGSSGSSLHAKTFAVDQARMFVGSYNFDPRSTLLNTELGFIIESPAMARRVDETFNTIVPAEAYRVELSQQGDLVWREQRPAGDLIHTSEPEAGIAYRLGLPLLGWLPIEWLL